MKKLMFIVFTIYLLSCNTFQIREDIKIFVDDIILNPTKLDNMEINYPLYFDSIFFNLYLGDSTYRNGIVKFILDTFSLDTDYEAHFLENNVSQLKLFKKYRDNIELFKNSNGIYSFFLVNDNDDLLELYFYIDFKDKMILFDIKHIRNFSKNFYP